MDGIDKLAAAAGMNPPEQPAEYLDPAAALAQAVSAQMFLVGVSIEGAIVLLYIASSWPSPGDKLQLCLRELTAVRWPWVTVDEVAWPADPETGRTWVVLLCKKPARMARNLDQLDALAVRMEGGARCPCPR